MLWFGLKRFVHDPIYKNAVSERGMVQKMEASSIFTIYIIYKGHNISIVIQKGR